MKVESGKIIIIRSDYYGYQN